MTEMNIRVKTKTGQQLLRGLTAASTIADLKRALSDLSKIPNGNLHVLFGFPPKPLDLSSEGRSLDETGLKNGDTLILENKPNFNQPTTEPEPEPEPTAPTQQGILMKHVVPADNSCLFSSVYYVLNGREDASGEVAPWMRQLVAETIARDKETYSEAILGKSNADYCRWIREDCSWGGAIELSILSAHYGIEIAVVDTVNAIINRFGEDRQYALRVFLMFDGIHYDPLYMESLDVSLIAFKEENKTCFSLFIFLKGGNVRTIFPTEDDSVLKEAQQIALEAKSSRQFTDVNKFTLKCMVCNVFMNGQVQAQQHAQSTGHQNFGEV